MGVWRHFHEGSNFWILTLFGSGYAGLGDSAMSNLQNEIGSLSAAEKFELLDVLWESLEADVPALTKEQQSEIDYRVTRYEQNPGDVIPWDQVRAELFKRQ
jgi:putative addiction module component (TIGR02574 family)